MSVYTIIGKKYPIQGLKERGNDMINDVMETMSPRTTDVIFYLAGFLKTLIQTGYEPQPPKPILGIDYYFAYPSPLRLVADVIRVDGVMGIFRGTLEQCFVSKLELIIGRAVWNKLFDPDRELNQYPTSRLSMAVILPRLLPFVISQPLHVIAVRRMLQFVGRETVYNTLLSSVVEIYRHEGVLGFFSGLVPRILADVLPDFMVVPAIVLTGSRFKVGVNIILIWRSVLHYLCYPFSVVTTVMAASGSNLQVVKRLMPSGGYRTWLHCLVDFTVKKRIYRGVFLQ